MTNIIITIIIAAAVGGAAIYICKAKKRGQTCIGCPYAKQCSTGKCGCKNNDQ